MAEKASKVEGMHECFGDCWSKFPSWMIMRVRAIEKKNKKEKLSNISFQGDSLSLAFISGQSEAVLVRQRIRNINQYISYSQAPLAIQIYVAIQPRAIQPEIFDKRARYIWQYNFQLFSQTYLAKYLSYICSYRQFFVFLADYIATYIWL